MRDSISRTDPLVFGLGGFVLLGQTVGVEPTLTESQSGVLPLHYAHHISGQPVMQTFAFVLSDVQMVQEGGLEPPMFTLWVSDLQSGAFAARQPLHKRGHYSLVKDPRVR